MQLAAFHYMPLAYQGLVVEITSRCNARCAMCYQAAGPKGSDLIGDASLTVAEVKSLIDEATAIPTLMPQFHLAGGEAFLKTDAAIELFHEASLMGYSEISTTTNCFWARQSKRADEIVRNARKAGLTRMEISWDHWHAPFIPQTAISNAILCCFEYGVSTTLRLLTTRRHSTEEALSGFSDEVLAMTSDISICPVFPTGRAASELPSEEIFNSGQAGGTCQSVLNLTVNARGNVFPCCAGSDQTEHLSFGNIREESIVDITARMNQSDLLRALVFLGPQALLPIVADLHDGTKDYANMCHLCWTLFSRPETAIRIKRWFADHDEAFSQTVAEVCNSFEGGPS